MKNIKKLANILAEEVDAMIESATKQIKANYQDEDHNKALKALGGCLFEHGIGTIYYEASEMQKEVGKSDDSKTLFKRDREYPKTRKTPDWINNAKSSHPDEMYLPHGVKELKAEIIKEVMKKIASDLE